MRIGGPIKEIVNSPEEWIQAHRKRGYTAAYCPPVELTDSAGISSYRRSALDADIMIAEVGAWSNPISPDEATRNNAIQKCQQQLALAEEIGARCCVNIAGSRSDIWDGPHEENITRDTFDLIVDSVREIIDAVKPRHSCYVLETMPWIFPYNADTYLDLIRAIDRRAFAVHLDPVNLIHNPLLYFNNADLIKECFTKLGPYIKSCHAKDIQLSSELTVRLTETCPGLGALDYRVFVQQVRQLPNDVPLMLEHLSTEEEYSQAAAHIRRLIM